MTGIYSYLYLGVLAFLVVVPGSALVIVKAPLLALFALFSGLMFMTRKIKPAYLAGAFFWIFITLFWWWLGFINNDARAAAREGAAYFVFAITILMLVAHYRYIPPKKFRWVVIGSFMLYALVKVGFLYMVLSGRISPEDAAELMKVFAPGSTVSGWLGEGGVPRVVFSNDYLLPVFLGWLLIEWRNLNIGRATFMGAITVTLFLVATSLSRYLLGFSVILLVAYWLYFHARMVSFLKVGVTICFAVIVGYVTLISLGYGDLLQRRLFGSGASSSDAAKIGQVGPLIELIDSGGIIGHGYGLSLESTGRGNKESFQAELQWLGLSAKIGLLGMLAVLVVLAMYFYRIMFRKENSIAVRLFISTTLVMWLIAGFFNPVLLLTTTTVNALLIYAMHDQHGNRGELASKQYA